MKQKIVIGLVGENGAGKETFSNFLSEVTQGKKVARVGFSDFLKKTLDLWGIPPTRYNLQEISIIMRRSFGEDIVPKGMKPFIEKTRADIIILDGVRWMVDVDLIRSFPKNSLIYITAPKKVRFERLKKRRQKVGEDQMSYKDFLDSEKRETEVMIPKIGKLSDFKIENSGTLQEFKSEVKQFYQKIKE